MIAGAWDLLAWAGFIVGFGLLIVLAWRDIDRRHPAQPKPAPRPARPHVRLIPPVYDEDLT